MLSRFHREGYLVLRHSVYNVVASLFYLCA